MSLISKFEAASIMSTSFGAFLNIAMTNIRPPSSATNAGEFLPRTGTKAEGQSSAVYVT